MEITVRNKVEISNAPGSLNRTLQDKLTFGNPKFLENQKMSRWNGETPEYLKCYEVSKKGDLILPRGYINQLVSLCKKYGENYQVIDRRRTLPAANFTFRGKLRPFQEEAVKDLLAHDFGTLSAPTASGKTVIALYLIAQHQQPALIVVHTKELLAQWVDRIEAFLGIPADAVGVIANGKIEIGEKITVALVQTLYKYGEEVSPQIGFLIVDECHRTPSRTFTEAVTAFDSKYMLGLSATPWRRDRLSRLIYWHLGDLVHEVEKDTLIENGHILRAEVITRETNFETSFDPSEEYSKMLSELTQDPERNSLIASDVAKEAKTGGGVCLVLSDRKAHCDAIQVLLWRNHKVGSELLTGDIKINDREAIVDKLNRDKVKVLIATGQLIGEGFDCPMLSTLFLATPIRFDGRVLQYLGRVLRPAPGKEKGIIYDYVDGFVGPLKAAAQARERVYSR